MRSADGNETAGAYQIGVEQTDRPTTFALSRQVVPNLAGTSKEGVAKGAYVVAGPAAGEDVDCIIIGTGTELELAVKAAEELGEEALELGELLEHGAARREQVDARIEPRAGVVRGQQARRGRREREQRARECATGRHGSVYIYMSGRRRQKA